MVTDRPLASETAVPDVAAVIRKGYDGQKVTLERFPWGNVGGALKEVCKTEKVIIPGPLRFAALLRHAAGDHWSVFVVDNFKTELYANDTERLPSQQLTEREYSMRAR